MYFPNIYIQNPVLLPEQTAHYRLGKGISLNLQKVMLGDYLDLPHEAFTEFLQGYTLNNKALKYLIKYFPRAHKVFLRIIKEAVNGK